MSQIVSVSPHCHGKITTQRIMRDVLIALAPALVAGVINFGWCALLVTAVCAAACMFFEWGFEKLCGKPSTISDLSAAVSGVLLAYNLPVSIPLWQAVFGALVAMVAVKGLFGGLGKNFANPAIVARIVLFLAFSSSMTAWVYPDGAVLSISVKNGRASLFYFFRACPLQFFLFRSIIYYEKVLNYRVEEQHDKNRI